MLERQNGCGTGEGMMADRRSLGLVGFFFCGVTAAVMLTAVLVVKHHVDGRLSLDGARMPVVASVQAVIR